MAYSAFAPKDFTSKAIDLDSGSEIYVISSLLPFLTGLGISFYLFLGVLDYDFSNYLDLNLYFIKGDRHSSILFPSSFSSTGTKMVFWAT